MGDTWGAWAAVGFLAGVGFVLITALVFGLPRRVTPPAVARLRRVSLDKWEFGALVAGRTIVRPARDDHESTVELALADIGFEEIRFAVQLAMAEDVRREAARQDVQGPR